MDKIIPSLAGFHETAVRLHPRREEPEPGLRSSKLGGRFLWPASEPWPRCTEPEDLSQWRDGALWSHPPRPHNDLYVGVLQLRADDFPEVEFPGGKDIFQLLWCPRNHEGTGGVVCKVFWWSESEIAETLEVPPPSYPDEELCPRPCRLYPERVAEYPDFLELNERQMGELEEWDGEEAWGGEEGVDIYIDLLSVCPGVKVGGHVDWIQDPAVPDCECGRRMSHLLTVSSGEFNRCNAERWCPLEDRHALDGTRGEFAHVQRSPGLTIGDNGAIYLFICRACEGWPIATVFQCS